MAFIDESGSVSNDRFFVLGCLRSVAPAELARRVRRHRDRTHFYEEIHFSRMTTVTRRHQAAMIDAIAEELAAGTLTFACCVCDRDTFDVVAECGGPYGAYEAVATRLLIDAVTGDELLSVIADDYSSPRGVRFEETVQAAVNLACGRAAVASLLRMDSRACDLLQLADLLTSIVGFEYRVTAGLASAASAKGRFVEWARTRLGCASLADASPSGLDVRYFRPISERLERLDSP